MDLMAETPSGLAQLWQLLRDTNLEHHAGLFLNCGIRSVNMLSQEADTLMGMGLSQSDLETLIAGCSQPDPVPRLGRRDHPVMMNQGNRASFTLALMAAQPNHRQRALDFLEQDVVAKSSHPALQSRIRTWRALCAAWEVPPFPLSFLNIKAVAASLKWGGYRSAQLYFQAAISHQTRSLQIPVDPFIKATIKDMCRSIKRGLGPASLKEGFDISILKQTVDIDDTSPFDPGCIAHATDMMLVAAWFMLREIEISFARLPHLTLDGPYVSLVLPVHKTNTAGGLTLRRLRCPCHIQIHVLCPWHAAERHLIRVLAASNAGTGKYMPLFPTSGGQNLSKYHLIQTIRNVLGRCGIPTTRSDGEAPPKQLFGGHCLRVSGAQYLASAGVPVAIIQMLGRWSSNAIERYIQSAPLALVPEVPSRVLNDGEDDIWMEPARVAQQPPQMTGERFISEPQEVPVAFDPSPIQKEIQNLTSQLADVRSMIELPLMNLVVRPQQSVAHIGSQFERVNNPQVWRTKCGWTYGTARFFRIPQLTEEFRQCKKCFGLSEAQQVASEEEDDDSGSEESSGSDSSEPSS